MWVYGEVEFLVASTSRKSFEVDTVDADLCRQRKVASSRFFTVSVSVGNNKLRGHKLLNFCRSKGDGNCSCKEKALKLTLIYVSKEKSPAGD